MKQIQNNEHSNKRITKSEVLLRCTQFKCFALNPDKVGTIVLLFCICCFFCQLPSAYCQLSKTDSLSLRLKKPIHDTDKVNTLNALAWALKYSNPDTAIIICNQSLGLAEKLQWKKGIANSLGNLGAYYYLKGDYPKALDYYLKALKLDEELGDKNGIAARLGNIGIVYRMQGDYPKALDYYFRALKTGEELGDKNRVAIQLGNIGLVYYDQGDYPRALDYYFRALKMAEELGNKNGIARHLGNIGLVHHKQAEAHPSPSQREELLNKALNYYFRALKMDEELGNKNGIAIHLGNIGLVYKDQAESAGRSSASSGSDLSRQKRDSLYNKALDYYFRALKMNEELGRKNGIAIWLGNIGSLYTETGKFKEAEEHLLQSIAIDSAIGAQNDERQVEELLSHLYDTTGRHKLALIHYKKAMALKDTIFSEEKNKELTRKEMNYEFEKKEAAAKAESDKQAAVAAAESKKQKIVIWSVIAVLLLVVVFAIFIFRALRLTQKQKGLIEQQKKLVEEKQNEILASIRYAKRIQTSLLPTEKYIDKTFKRLMKK